MSFVLACDLGGTRIKLGVAADGRLLAARMIPSHSTRPLAEALPRIEAALREACDETGVAVADCRGIGVGFPALVDNTNGRVLDEYGKFADAPGLDLPAWASDALGLPLAIENDARLACIGEWRHGAGRGSNDLAIITLGTGIGTAVISQGCVLRGRHFQAGNLGGHLTVDPDGRRCVCGNVGCVEAETASLHLPAIAAALPGFGTSSLADRPGLDYGDVFAAADAGDAVAMALRDRSIRLWAVLCVDLIHAFDLDRIVLGGGVMAAAATVLPPLTRYVQRHANTPWGAVEVRAAEHPDTMALLGCEWLVQEHLASEPDRDTP